MQGAGKEDCVAGHHAPRHVGAQRVEIVLAIALVGVVVECAVGRAAQKHSVSTAATHWPLRMRFWITPALPPPAGCRSLQSGSCGGRSCKRGAPDSTPKRTTMGVMRAATSTQRRLGWLPWASGPSICRPAALPTAPKRNSSQRTLFKSTLRPRLKALSRSGRSTRNCTVLKLPPPPWRAQARAQLSQRVRQSPAVLPPTAGACLRLCTRSTL